jgi:lipopolysaccharide export system protein LptA
VAVLDSRRLRRLLLGLLTLGLWALAAEPVRAQSAPARLQTEPPNDAKPVIVTSDEAIAWNEGNLQVLIVRGNVSVEQGLLRGRMNQAVLWMAGTEAEKGKSLPVTLYGEGDVVVERGGVKAQHPRALLELRTQDAFRLKSARPVRATASDDPFYRRSVAERDKLMAEPVTPVNARPASAESPAPVMPASSPAPVKTREIQAIPTQTPDRRPEPLSGGVGLGGLTRRPKVIRVTPRNTTRFDADIKPGGPNEQVIVITGGVQVYVDDLEQVGIVDMSTDRAVLWVRNVDAQGFLSGAASGDATDAQIEAYLEGHVEIRRETTRGPNAGATQILKADQAYYDVSRNVAQLINAEVVATQPGLPNEVHLRAQEIRQTAANRFEASQAAVYSSRLPSDPDLFVQAQTASLEIREVPVSGLFGSAATDESGQPLKNSQLYGVANDITLNVLDVPIFYLPSVEGDLRDPLGPLEQVRFKHDRIFGTGLLVDWDMFKLLGLEAPSGARWRLETDYLSKRGPALGTTLETAGHKPFGLPGNDQTLLKAYGIYDDGTDILGPGREYDPSKNFRGRVLFRRRHEITPDLTLLSQINFLSDRNFLEQYYKREFDDDFVQDTFTYLKKQHDFWALTLQTQMNIRSWVTQTEWLPLFEGRVIGYSPFERLTYFARGSAGFANQQATSDLTQSYLATPFLDEFERTRPLPPSSDLPHFDSINSGRFDLWQEFDLPLSAGPFKVVPYGLFDITHYTETLVDEQVTRLYGGGGVRASIPFTRVYPEVCSQLFNLNGIAHKIVVMGDYRFVQSNEDFRELPLLDRLDDDATDQARRDLRINRLQTSAPGSTAFNLATSPLYDPQLYALRRGLETSLENLDDLQIVRLGVRQRWQTKRGFPGAEHILDWMTLDLRGTFFPDADRDNFGHDFAFLEYDYTWHVGDRTTLLSSGWMDPFPDGARVWNIGVVLDRPERALFYIGYRQIEPVDSQAVIIRASYIFSPKWAGTVGTIYDFGQKESLGTALVLTRIGTDLQVSLGFNYDALQNNFGVTFEVMPALAGSRIRGMSPAAVAATGFGR